MIGFAGNAAGPKHPKAVLHQNGKLLCIADVIVQKILVHGGWTGNVRIKRRMDFATAGVLRMM